MYSNISCDTNSFCDVQTIFGIIVIILFYHMNVLKFFFGYRYCFFSSAILINIICCAMLYTANCVVFSGLYTLLLRVVAPSHPKFLLMNYAIMKLFRKHSVNIFACNHLGPG